MSNMISNSGSKTDKRRIGDIGEDLVCQFLKKNKFKIVDRNFLKKYGEIDIVALKEGTYHFIEVKSVSGETGVSENNIDNLDQYRPEDNVHPFKIRRLRRVIEVYIISHKIWQGEWQFDVFTVRLDFKTRQAKICPLYDIVL